MIGGTLDFEVGFEKGLVRFRVSGKHFGVETTLTREEFQNIINFMQTELENGSTKVKGEQNEQGI
jgi:hypothetical protein